MEKRSMNNCPTEETLSRYHDQENVGEFDGHIRECLDCQRQLKEFVEIENVLVSPLRPSTRTRTRKWPGWAYAVAGLAVVSSLFVMRPEYDQELYTVEAVDGQRYRVSTGTQTTLLSLEINGEQVLRSTK
jgi:hypothetical protein